MLGGQPTGKPERMDSEGQVRWEAVNSAWGKLLRESETQLSGYSQNLRMQGQYLYQYAPNALGWVDPWGLKCKSTEDGPILGPHGSLKMTYALDNHIT